jgi:trk system potassium uptake protein TrkA
MRVVFIGASELTVRTTRLLLDRGDEVVIIEADRERIGELEEGLDCAFLHGDGSKPAVLKEAGPDRTDLLFCITDSDLVNIIASVVGKSLGFGRIVTKIEDPDFQSICQELGFEDTIIPAETISRYLADIVGGYDVLELRTMIRGEARTFSFEATQKEDGATIAELDLPPKARVICYYRNEEFRLPESGTRLKAGDVVVMLTHSSNIEALRERWRPEKVGDAPKGKGGRR